ncbi:TRAP transporter large permease [Propionimicrobium sp. PCR01-08-3]|uniref:TRAP transporter large permease n=1 Tax=Propionimicrobium sp. PCR01-08-3 TaxID=3052086 RepID=UPI00255CA526|nr:TRAP transporter large permease [Propionimicrobium sp. PCR01-08-3]WIY81785.1 TRAP transporter large permease [Propionimicrobium sp. PCR01-08-3]
MTIGLAIAVLFATFFVLLFLGLPISVSIGVSSIATTLFFLPWDQATFIVMQKMNNGIDSFNLIAIPLFVLAGNIMNNGGIARRLIRFAQLVVGRIPGSLVQTNILGNMLFGALSGSAVAAAAAIGGTLSPLEKEEGYDPAFSAAANISSAPTGLLIPPTAAFIVYSTIAGGVSISALFMAGLFPGILMGVVSMVIAFVYAKRHNYPTSPKVPIKERAKITLDAIPSLLLIIIVIGGIVAGIFTATEGAGIAVFYCLILSLIYRSLNAKNFMDILLKSTATTGIILFLISASTAMSWVMSYTGIPTAISEGMLSLSENPLVIFLMMNVILLVVGMFIDITPAILIFTPIFLPIATSLGMDPIHFGVVLVFNMCLGTMTPPVGSVLFVGAGVGNVSLEKVIPRLLPYIFGIIAMLLLVTYLPTISMWLPGLMGLLS